MRAETPPPVVRLDPVRLIWPLRALNVVGRWLARLGIAPRLDPDRLEARARAATGLDDFGEPSYRAPLERLCAELDGPARLTTAGRLSARDQVVRGLSNRLLLAHALAGDPDLLTAPLIDPLVVIGLPRSGTTWLHRVLCHAPGALPLPTWALQRPMPPVAGPDDRLEAAHTLVRDIRRMAPALDAKHHLDAEQPEECMLLLDAALASLTYGFMFPVPDYTAQIIRRDGVADYRCWRACLTRFQRQQPDGRLTLKAPVHTAFLRAIWHHVPGARVVMPHRDPARTVASLCSLFHTMHGLATDHIDRDALGRSMLDLCAVLAERAIADRDAHPGQHVVDVAYHRLVADPVPTVLDIYAGHGLPVDGALEDAVRRAVADRPQHLFGRHEYALADFGLDRATVYDRLAPYLDRFGEYIRR